MAFDDRGSEAVSQNRDPNFWQQLKLRSISLLAFLRLVDPAPGGGAGVSLTNVAFMVCIYRLATTDAGPIDLAALVGVLAAYAHKRVSSTKAAATAERLTALEAKAAAAVDAVAGVASDVKEQGERLLRLDNKLASGAGTGGRR